MSHLVSFKCTCDYVNLYFAISDCTLLENSISPKTRGVGVWGCGVVCVCVCVCVCVGGGGGGGGGGGRVVGGGGVMYNHDNYRCPGDK